MEVKRVGIDRQFSQPMINLNDDDAHTRAHTISRDDDWRGWPMMTNHASDRLNVSEIILNQSEDTDVFATDHHDGRWRRPIHNQRRRRPMMTAIHDDNDDGWQRQAMTVDWQQPRPSGCFFRFCCRITAKTQWFSRPISDWFEWSSYLVILIRFLGLPFELVTDENWYRL